MSKNNETLYNLRDLIVDYLETLEEIEFLFRSSNTIEVDINNKTFILTIEEK